MTTLCSVCNLRPAVVVIHGEAGAPAGYCEDHAPLKIALGDSAGRAAVAEGAHHANPDAPGALYDLAALSLRSGREGEAVRLARRLVALEPGRPIAHELLSEALERSVDARGAEEAIRRAIATGRGDGETYARLGRLAAGRDDLTAALAAFEAGFAADPWSFECCRRAAVLRIALGAAERALELCERYLAETDARRASILEVAPSVGPGAVPGAPPPATVARFPSELEYREALRREGGRRSHMVAAARFQARILAGDALRSLGRTAEAARSYEAAAGEVAGHSPILLMEAGLDLGKPA